jgi:hypothetical protein
MMGLAALNPFYPALTPSFIPIQIISFLSNSTAAQQWTKINPPDIPAPDAMHTNNLTGLSESLRSGQTNEMECAMKTLICTALVASSLAFTGNAAMAAHATTHTTATVHTVHARVVVTHRGRAHWSVASARLRGRVIRGRYAERPYGYGRDYGWFDIGRFLQAMFSGGPVRYAAVVHGGRYSYSAPDSPTYDDSPVASGTDDTAQQAIDAANETNMENSMQAAQEQNDEANAETNAGIAAAEQTEINSGM